MAVWVKHFHYFFFKSLKHIFKKSKVKKCSWLLWWRLKFYFRHKTRPKGSTKGTEKQDWCYKIGLKIRKECEKSYQIFTSLTEKDCDISKIMTLIRNRPTKTKNVLAALYKQNSTPLKLCCTQTPPAVRWQQCWVCRQVAPSQIWSHMNSQTKKTQCSKWDLSPRITRKYRF